MRVYVGWDEKDANAWRVAERSLMKHATLPVSVHCLSLEDLRQRNLYSRPYYVDHVGQMWDGVDGKPFSTAFSFSRFCIPAVMDYADEWVLFTDADVMWRADIAEMIKHIDDRYGVMCVHHEHRPTEKLKMTGVLQTQYERKNWSSVMLMNPSKCKRLTPYVVNNWSGADLHRMLWIEDELIGALPEKWNWLEGWSDPEIDPALVHYTRGTPDMERHGDLPFADEWWSYLAPMAARVLAQ